MTKLDFSGIKCKVCGKDEMQLEHLGIAMNIPLETCNRCLGMKPNVAVVDTVVHKKHPGDGIALGAVNQATPSCRQLEAEKFVMSLKDMSTQLIEDMINGQVQTNRMISDFLRSLQEAERISRL